MKITPNDNFAIEQSAQNKPSASDTFSGINIEYITSSHNGLRQNSAYHAHTKNEKSQLLNDLLTFFTTFPPPLSPLPKTPDPKKTGTDIFGKILASRPADAFTPAVKEDTAISNRLKIKSHQMITRSAKRTMDQTAISPGYIKSGMKK